jgi:hypothetical protein
MFVKLEIVSRFDMEVLSIPFSVFHPCASVAKILMAAEKVPIWLNEHERL